MYNQGRRQDFGRKEHSAKQLKLKKVFDKFI